LKGFIVIKKKKLENHELGAAIEIYGEWLGWSVARFSEGLGLVVDVVNTAYLYGSTAAILYVLQHSCPENILFHLSPAL